MMSSKIQKIKDQMGVQLKKTGSPTQEIWLSYRDIKESKENNYPGKLSVSVRFHAGVEPGQVWLLNAKYFQQNIALLKQYTSVVEFK